MNFPIFSKYFTETAPPNDTLLFLGLPTHKQGEWPDSLNSWIDSFLNNPPKSGLFSFQQKDFTAFLFLPESLIFEDLRRQISSIKVGKFTQVFSFLPRPLALVGLESIALSNYSFQRTQSLHFCFAEADDQALSTLTILVDAVYQVRDWVNSPHNQLNSVTLHNEIQRLAAQYGLKYQGLGPKAIEALKMAGLEAVNKGSQYPPLFAILEYCPVGKENENPIVLVGKGVMFDTGGHSLKTAKGMEDMKGDMAGAATVLGTIMALARNNHPEKVVALLPITDNRLAPSSLSPGDIIEFSNGLSVEVLNTDAEGRLILADALLYASKLNPTFVLDLATLTGSAHAAVGEGAMVAFQAEALQTFENLKKAGERVGEPIVHFPLLHEYEDQLKSTVAHIRNIGNTGLAGSITAALFLKRFTNYPWIHIDLSMALANTPCFYRSAGGTGSGVRLLLDFFNQDYTFSSFKP